MSGKVDLSLCQEGDVCEVRRGPLDVFIGPTPRNHPYRETHPYLTRSMQTFRQDGTAATTEGVEWNDDIVRVTRNGIQITPVWEPVGFPSEFAKGMSLRDRPSSVTPEEQEAAAEIRDADAPGGAVITIAGPAGAGLWVGYHEHPNGGTCSAIWNDKGELARSFYGITADITGPYVEPPPTPPTLLEAADAVCREAGGPFGLLFTGKEKLQALWDAVKREKANAV